MKLLSSKKELNDYLLKVIKESKNTLIIISPFIDFHKWDDMINTLKGKNDILEIYTNLKNMNEIKETKVSIIETIEKKIVNENNIVPINNLHAKIYINDDTALLSSMNLVYSSYNKSIDFGIVTENPEERKAVIDYCSKNIFIYNRNTILEYFEKEGIKAENIEFEKNRYFIAKINEPVIFLKLSKDKGTYIRCSVDKYDTSYPDKIFFYFEINKDNKQLKNREINIAGIQWSDKRKSHYLSLSRKNYDGVWVIPAINVFGKEILETLMKIYNSI